MWQYLRVPKSWKRAPKYWQCLGNKILYTWVRASWIEFNNFPTRCDLFSLLHFCRQLYMFRVLTPIIRSSYSCDYSFWYWLTGSTTIRFSCWVGTKKKFREYYSYYFFFFFWHYKPTWLLVLCTRLFQAFLSSTSWLQFLSFRFCS